MNAGRVEAELKYLAADERPLVALEVAETLGPATLGGSRRVAEEDRYLDTADGRLAGLRWACRLRAREGRTIVSLKGPAEHGPGDPIHRRRELEGPAGADLDPRSWPASRARDELLAMTRGAGLQERLRLEQVRAERDVRLDGRTIGRLSLDRVRVLHGAAEVGTLLVVELEFDRRVARSLDPQPLAAALDQTAGLSRDSLTKLERGLGMLQGA